MPDKTSLGISEPLRLYIENLVKNVALQGESFESQKDWLHKYCVTEGLDYKTLEGNLIILLESIKELEEHESLGTKRLLEMVSKDCGLSESTTNEILCHASTIRAQKHAKQKAPAKEVQDPIGDRTIPNTERKHLPLRIINGTVYGTNPGFDGDLIIPSELEGQTVTSIGIAAFMRHDLRSVKIPNTVTRLDGSSFSNCFFLSSVTLPNSVKRIGNQAFECCRNLKSIIIPDSVSLIESLAFNKCDNLTKITIPNSVEHIGQYAFYGCPLNEISIGWQNYAKYKTHFPINARIHFID